MILGEGDRLKRGETRKSVEETKIFKKGAAGSRICALKRWGWGRRGVWNPLTNYGIYITQLHIHHTHTYIYCTSYIYNIFSI